MIQPPQLMLFPADPIATVADTSAARYSHTQSGRIHILLELVAIVLLAIIWLLPDAEILLLVALTLAGGILFLLAMMFRTLTIREEDNSLLAKFGPLGVFRRRMPFEKMLSAEAGKTSFIDGLGYHWIPGRGWTMNIAGSDCVIIRLVNGSTLRLGTDDVPGLLAVIERRLGTKPQR